MYKLVSGVSGEMICSTTDPSIPENVNFFAFLQWKILISCTWTRISTNETGQMKNLVQGHENDIGKFMYGNMLHLCPETQISGLAVVTISQTETACPILS